MKVLLVSSSFFGYEERLMNAFKNNNCEVAWLDDRLGNSTFFKAVTRLNLLKYFSFLINHKASEIIRQAILDRPQCIVFVDPETLDSAAYKRIKQELPGTDIVIYRWDSLQQKPLPQGAFDVAKAVYSFDPTDCQENPAVKHLPLFHNYGEFSNLAKKTETKNDLCFVGTTHSRRVKILAKIGNECIRRKHTFFFFLKAQSYFHLIYYSILAWWYGYRGKISVKGLAYDEYLKILATSNTVVDVEYKKQTGLTMRTFEVIFSGTPIVTTNSYISNYDFYDQNSILIVNEQSLNLEGIDKLSPLNTEQYFEKYHIDTWANILLGRVELPEYFT